MSTETQQQATPQEAIDAVKQIIANDTPENREKYPLIFAEAEKLGMLKGDGAGAAPDPFLLEIQSRYGNAYKSKEDFFAEVDQIKSNGGNVSMDVFKALPEPLFNAIDKAVKGENWVEAIKGVPYVDYNKSYNADELLAIYYPNKFTPEEIADAENVAVKTAKKASEQKFLLDKQEAANTRLMAQTQDENKKRLARESLDKTIADFKKKALQLNPKLEPATLASWESRLRSELSTMNFQSRFFDGKGGFTEEAASNLFPLAFPVEFTAQWKMAGRQEAMKETDGTLQTFVNRGGAPREYNRSGAGAAPAAKNNMDQLVKTFTQGESTPYKITPVKQ